MKHTHTTLFHITVYAMLLVFLLAAAFGLIEPLQRAAADSEQIEEEVEIFYDNSYELRGTDSETVTCMRYTVSEGSANTDCPKYYNTDGTLTNSCAPVAGAIVVGYYDRLITAMIPEFVPGVLVNNDYYYYSMSTVGTTIQPLIGSLYSLMGTNTLGNGTTRDQYRAGINSHVTAAGYMVNFTNLMSAGALKKVETMDYISYGRVISLYVTNFNLTTVTLGNTSNVYTIQTFVGKHILVAYKYKLIKYYNSFNTNFRTDIFLYVSTGMSSTQAGWFYVGYYGSTLDYADGTLIF